MQYSYHPPEYFEDGLEVGSLEEVDIDSALLKKAMDRINCDKYGEVHSMLIFRDSKLVFEEYFDGHRYQWDGANHHGEKVKWAELGPKIQGKIHIWMGDMDNYYLNNAMRDFNDYLQTTTSPKSDAEILFSPTCGHCENYSNRTYLEAIQNQMITKPRRY